MTRSHLTILALVVALLWGGACSLITDLGDITGGLGGSGGSVEVGGEGGSEGPCVSVTDCPTPDNPCESPVCLGGVCGTVAVQSGVILPDNQEPGDCMVAVCDGAGGVTELNDDNDAPTDTECTDYSCLSGVLQTTHQVLGESCAAGLCDGLGECVQCMVPSDCEGTLPPSDECQERACANNVCAMDPTAEGTPLAAQSEGDCKVAVCDGSGASREEAAPLDRPDDGNNCTQDLCIGDTPDHPPEDPGTVCGGGFCDGAGSCGDCQQASDCGEDGSCVSWTCSSGDCLAVYVAPNTPLQAGEQVVGDCQEKLCDGNGGIITQGDDNDDPPDDNLECTAQDCVNGSPQWPPVPLDDPCGPVQELVCDGQGACVDCNNPSQCDEVPDCQVTTCVSNQCGQQHAPQGTPAGQQAVGDCQLVVCDGSGGTESEEQDSDLPVDGNDCTSDVCTQGVPSNLPSGVGSDCDQDGGSACDGAGNCVPCVGDADCPLSHYCASYNCAPDEPLAAPCTRGTMCASHYCADDVCCDTACDAYCESCSGSSSVGVTGQCAAIKPLTDPDDDCLDEAVCLNVNVCCVHESVQYTSMHPMKPGPAMGPCP